MRFEHNLDGAYSILIHPDGRIEEEYYNNNGFSSVTCSANAGHEIQDEFEEMIRDIGYDHGGL